MERIKRLIRELSEQQWLEVRELREWEILSSTYTVPGQYEQLQPYTQGDNFDLFPSIQGTTYFFRCVLEIPPEWKSGRAGLIFESGGEGLLRVNGQSRQGLDRNHTFVTLEANPDGSPLELEIELFDPIPEPVDPLNQQAVIQPPIRAIRSRLVRVNLPVQSLMYTATVIRDAAILLPEQDMRRARMLEALYQCMDGFLNINAADIRQGDRIASLEQQLRNRIKEIGGNAEGLIHMIGQSHIDIAWLWPARETVRKTSRTFSTVNALMEEYPDYQYAQSQPLLFQYLKDNDPVLYEQVKARIKEGRWELVGGMWIEPDLNIPSGESLMRQMLYGQRFYLEEFGRTSAIEWLPDTFGYCASLPQILKHGGIEYFMTTKLGWNDTNVFPYNLFHWVGIDGTAMLSYLNHGVNENTLPLDVHEHWQSFREKEQHNEQMLLYGHGDGGGGVTREMLEYIQRAELMVGQPASVYSNAAAFFEGIRREQPQLPQWRGDLYLELHRGTYTTHSRNKRNNRKAEILYREAELWQALAAPELGPEERKAYAEQLHAGWKLILLNQFHDIIPGSAITEAYETSEKEYKDIFARGTAVLEPVLADLAGRIDTAGAGRAYVVFNSLGWARDAVVELPAAAQAPNGEPLSAYVYDEHNHLLDCEWVAEAPEGASIIVRVPQVPACGYRTIWLRSQAEGTEAAPGVEVSPVHAETLLDCWETEYYRIQFNSQGEIARLYDKLAGRDIVKPGQTANRFHFFHDRPTLWDAWDIDSRYEAQPAGEAELAEKRVVSSGAVRDVLRFRWKLNHSEITQDLILYHQDRRIDFRTHVSWKESHKLLKVGFPIDVVTDKATYEIPFGALERPTHRNTSWEQAQYEVCGHRFADVSEHGYGVSLLNDCKYGYDVQGSTIRLSLLRAPKWPDATADLGEHDFTYSLYPHQGDWREAHTLRAAAELNHEPAIAAAEGKAARLPSTGTFAGFTGQHVVLDTVKPSEDGRGSILRLYESSGGRETVRLQWNQSVNEIFLANALEEEIEQVQHQEGAFELQFAPFEIKTICIR
ncbi:alpha-mannosidase [Paenibacillus donghaensis]|uniref:alpha-mannosidase n=1 Tax=Paenibacillus donghaensis TaxID=414771 RepID=A0A2Z2KGJ6_9BACL|nr:alpha-mannosidase [Paenibacillus donghaensis]ASA25876.1 alpha-mannosidase [Paenibacillus donghaensis]